jgi:hypothetical protein
MKRRFRGLYEHGARKFSRGTTIGCSVSSTASGSHKQSFNAGDQKGCLCTVKADTSQQWRNN